MATLKTKFMVGVFVITGFSMAIVVVVWLGMSNYLEKGQYYVAYFDESVQGLDKDSPVKYRGVTIGNVNAIGVAPDANLIQVVLKIETDIQLDESIVAQLKSVGITGIMFVELEKKDTDARLPIQQIDFPTPYPVISTKPSDIKEFFDTVSDVLLEFNRLDIQGFSLGIQSTLSKLERAIDDAQIEKLMHELHATLSGIQKFIGNNKWESVLNSFDQAAMGIRTFSSAGTQTAENVDAILARVDEAVGKNEQALQTLLADVNASILHMDALIAKGSQFLGGTHKETARLLPQLKQTLRQYEKAGRHLSRFLEQVSEQPSQLFFGAPSEEEDISSGE
jgi:phospholipid/cholesterol/gamma-HCH transport system substrate-binding protein